MIGRIRMAGLLAVMLVVAACGASGSSTIKTSDFASPGTPLILNSGLTFAPLQVNFAGISLPGWKAELVREMEEVAFRRMIAPRKTAKAKEISFTAYNLATKRHGQALGRGSKYSVVPSVRPFRLDRT